VRFFFDNCVSPHIVEALVCLEPRHELVHLRARFAPSTPDPEWIRQLGQEVDWIIISGDPRISRGQAEKAAWVESGLTAFFCGEAWQNRRLVLQASELLRWWDHIVLRSKNAEKGSGHFMEFGMREPRQIYPTREPRRKRKGS
jgi:PIN domain-containing protein